MVEERKPEALKKMVEEGKPDEPEIPTKPKAAAGVAALDAVKAREARIKQAEAERKRLAEAEKARRAALSPEERDAEDAAKRQAEEDAKKAIEKAKADEEGEEIKKVRAEAERRKDDPDEAERNYKAARAPSKPQTVDLSFEQPWDTVKPAASAAKPAVPAAESKPSTPEPVKAEPVKAGPVQAAARALPPKPGAPRPVNVMLQEALGAKQPGAPKPSENDWDAVRTKTVDTAKTTSSPTAPPPEAPKEQDDANPRRGPGRTST